MDMKYEYYGQYISEDSIIRLTDGTEIKGKEAITKGILECCEIFHHEHNNRIKKVVIKYGIVPAAIGVVVGIGVYKIMELKKKKQSEQK